MITEAHTLTISGLRVAVVRKAIKNLHLGVYPPDGQVRVAAPLAVSDAAVRVAVIDKLRWIRRQREAFANQARESSRELVSGESHYYRGRRYRLDVIEVEAAPRVDLRGHRSIVLSVRPEWTVADRERLLQRWYRARLREAIPPLVVGWQERLNVTVRAWGIKRMKTKWGSCNAAARRIWLNLELIKKPPSCLEYVLVHELVHLVARNHDGRFQSLMDQHLPTWRQRRSELNATLLAPEAWSWSSSS